MARGFSITAWAARQASHEGAYKDPRPVECRSCGWHGERRQNRRACPKCHGGRIEWVHPPAENSVGVRAIREQGNLPPDDPMSFREVETGET